MSKSYSRASDGIIEQMTSVLNKYCPDLRQEKVRIDVLSVAETEEGVPPLTLHGVPCAATIKIRDTKLRAMGLGDAVITIDEKQFIDLPEKTQEALLHHELYHLELKRSRYGKVQKDEHNRPRLTMREHDHNFGWFSEVARVHGKFSMEVRQASALILSGKQLYFEFALKGEVTAADLGGKPRLFDGLDVEITTGGKTVYSSPKARERKLANAAGK